MKFFWKYVFPPLYGLLIYFTIRLLLDTVTGMKFWHRPLTAVEAILSIFVGYLLIRVFNRLFRYFDEHWPATFSYKQIARELLYVFLVNLIFQNAILTTWSALTDDGLQWFDLADINTIPLLYVLIYYGMMRSRTFLKAFIESKIQLEKITNDQLQTELKFLKAQYHPHFLFNALNTIYFQMDEDVTAAKRSVEKFSELLRYQLYDQQHTVPVSQEVRYLANFIQLQQIRASEKLRLTVHFDANLDGQQVYPLLFLPLVENAFKYVGGDYRIGIDARLDDSTIRLAVENSVPEEIPLKKVKNEGGIGLENLQRRLELLYPGKHSLTAEKKENTFAAVLTLKLP